MPTNASGVRQLTSRHSRSNDQTLIFSGPRTPEICNTLMKFWYVGGRGKLLAIITLLYFFYKTLLGGVSSIYTVQEINTIRDIEGYIGACSLGGHCFEIQNTTEYQTPNKHQIIKIYVDTPIENYNAPANNPRSFTSSPSPHIKRGPWTNHRQLQRTFYKRKFSPLLI